MNPDRKPSLPRVFLLTGPPGSGKTTLLQEIIPQLGGRAGGFYTTELREQGRRVGFEIVTLEGERGLLAHVRFASPHRVGHYGVDLGSLERVGVSALRRAMWAGQLLVVDEIGKMELGSAAFRETVLNALNGEAWLLGTILQAPHPWADDLKRDRRVQLLRVTRGAWQGVRQEVVAWVNALPGLRPRLTGTKGKLLRALMAEKAKDREL